MTCTTTNLTPHHTRLHPGCCDTGITGGDAAKDDFNNNNNNSNNNNNNNNIRSQPKAEV